MNFQQYISKEKSRVNKMTSKQKEYIIANVEYLERLDISIKDIELELIGKNEAKEIIEKINELRDEDLWVAYTNDI
ncbi:hypothetical protein LCFBJUUZ_CDS0074 [Staphylococcus phage PG-2021_76]|uniref:Uncharacterized protein n=1 Tax=Mammaliicoccus phage MSShimriz1 TaxID=3230127 RepID=A0AAU8GS16_9VIRU